MKKLIIYSLFFILILGCAKKPKQDTGYFLSKINIEKWNYETHNYIERSYSDSINSLYYINSSQKDGIKYITKRKDTIRTFEEHINLYLKNRKKLLVELIKNKSLLTKSTDTLVISESYSDVYNPKTSYIVVNDNMKHSFIFYFNSDSFEKFDALAPDGLKSEYDSVIYSKPRHIIQFKNLLNAVDIQTVFYIKDSIMISELKWVYLGSVTID